MDMQKENKLKIPDIIIKELNQETNLEEKMILHEWLSQSENNILLFERLKQKENLVSVVKERNKINKQDAWEKINAEIMRIEPGNRFSILRMLRYAAIIVIPLLIASYFLLHKKSLNSNPPISFSALEKQVQDFDQSSLITSNGEIITLGASKDSIFEIDATKITKGVANISYSTDKSQNDQGIKYNTLVTPKSKVFSIILADGTKVWLNASSAIKYPTQFTSDVRNVYLTGEAFFEVAKDASKPFIVFTKNMSVEALGTAFNVMAYPDDEVTEATLVKGGVSVKTVKNELILEPGNQARFNKITENLQKRLINVELFTSWKDGKYIFEYENIETVLTKISRWYDVDVSYLNNDVKKIHFSGTLFKYNDIKQTLHIIELATNVKIDLVNNSIQVNKK
ncbi:MAG: FecR domain-containing protein [Lentimicrobiaceae bacterium]|jgi:ferric-dicitrate binding protein FerR (iron transport regulator)